MPLLAFLRRPTLRNRPVGPGGDGLARVLRLYGVDLGVMALLGAIASIAIAAGFEIPSNQLDSIELAPGWIAAIVVGAPVIEEIVFRSWLSGRPGHLVAAALSVPAVALLPAAFLADSGASTAQLSALGAGLLLLALIALYYWRRSEPLAWFARAFPVIFWLVAAGFAAAHLTNYSEGAFWVLAPLVLPQFVIGTLAGYARVQLGLWAAMLLHAMHNGTAVGLILLLGEALPAGTGAS